MNRLNKIKLQISYLHELSNSSGGLVLKPRKSLSSTELQRLRKDLFIEQGLSLYQVKKEALLRSGVQGKSVIPGLNFIIDLDKKVSLDFFNLSKLEPWLCLQGGRSFKVFPPFVNNMSGRVAQLISLTAKIKLSAFLKFTGDLITLKGSSAGNSEG